jgi:hypothetical protein
MIYFTADTKAMPESVQGGGVNFYIDVDFASAPRSETLLNGYARFRCVFGSTNGYGI